MNHLTVHEWRSVPVRAAASPGAFSRAQADALLAAARAHPLAGKAGTRVLADRRDCLKAGGLVGVIAAEGCSLEILPKLDLDERDAPEDKARARLRTRLLRMLDVVWDLNLGVGEAAQMARQEDSLLEVLIRLFAQRLLDQTRRGLPRLYRAQEDDLPALRGRLDVMRQFTVHAVRPDRLACRFDELSHDIALLQVMKACVVLLRRHARGLETCRLLDELRFVLADVSEVAPRDLPWQAVRIDRSNRGWQGLFDMASQFLRRTWQATHHDSRAERGFTLLFAMNDLFEAYVAALLERHAPAGWTVTKQGRMKYCLTEDGKGRFQTKPDILVRQGNKTSIIDTKWKAIGTDPEDEKHGISQADVYQMMAYGQLYGSPDLILLYPHHAKLGKAPVIHGYKVNPVNGSNRSLRVATVLLAPDSDMVGQQLWKLLIP